MKGEKKTTKQVSHLTIILIFLINEYRFLLDMCIINKNRQIQRK